jgi:hypothetical protein
LHMNMSQVSKCNFPKRGPTGAGSGWDPDRLEKLYETVESIKRKYNFTDRQALKFMVNHKEHAATWGVPKAHKGSKEQWIETLEARLQDAKSHRKLHEKAERELQEIEASMKFRK